MAQDRNTPKIISQPMSIQLNPMSSPSIAQEFTHMLNTEVSIPSVSSNKDKGKAVADENKVSSSLLSETRDWTRAKWALLHEAPMRYLEQALDGFLSLQVMSNDVGWDSEETEYSRMLVRWDIKSEGGLLMGDVDVRGLRSGCKITFTYHLRCKITFTYRLS